MAAERINAGRIVSLRLSSGFSKGFEYPDGGSQRKVTENTRINRIPRTKLGMAIPSIAMNRLNWSSTEFLRRAGNSHQR
jgi:hypothetical protein